MVRVREALGDLDGVELEPLDEVVGNSSPIESPLMDGIGDCMGEPAQARSRTTLFAFTDSRMPSATPSPIASHMASSRTST